MGDRRPGGEGAAETRLFADDGAVNDGAVPEEHSAEAAAITPERLRLWVEEAERRAEAVERGYLALVDADVVLTDPYLE